MMNSGHSGFSSSRLGASWGTGCRVTVHSSNREHDSGGDVQTISRQLYAILVVKLDGKAPGIVQLFGKGEGGGRRLEAWRQLKLQYEGKSGNRQTALLRGILNPRAGGDADAREGTLSGRVAEQVGGRPSPSFGQRAQWTSQMAS